MDNMRCILFPLWCNNDVEFLLTGLCCWLCGQTAVWRSSEWLLPDLIHWSHNKNIIISFHRLLLSHSSAQCHQLLPDTHTHTEAVIVKPHRMLFLACSCFRRNSSEVRHSLLMLLVDRHNSWIIPVMQYLLRSKY